MSLLPLLVSASPPIQWLDLGLTRGIDLGFFMLRWYSLAYLAAILLGYWQLTKMIKLPGAPMGQRHIEDIFFYCTLGIILGGRLGYAAFYSPELLTQPGELIKLWNGGMSFHGGFLGATLAVAWVAWRGKLDLLRVTDYMGILIPVGLIPGRLANFVNGELWGKVAGPDVSWAMVFPDGGPLARHPSQLYQMMLEGVLLAAIMLFLFWKTGARFRKGWPVLWRSTFANQTSSFLNLPPVPGFRWGSGLPCR
jgi:phosphatidylglycerol---prolipoprotein diacylglyceryl transferase